MLLLMLLLTLLLRFCAFCHIVVQITAVVTATGPLGAFVLGVTMMTAERVLGSCVLCMLVRLALLAAMDDGFAGVEFVMTVE